MREAIDNLLHAAGFSAVAHSSAESLLAECNPVQGLCVVCDIALPAMSGFELQTELRARGANLPFIFIAANDTPSVRRKAKRCGAAYLVKPLLGGALLAAVSNAVRPLPKATL